MKDEHKRFIYDSWLSQILQRDAYKLVVDDGLIENASSQASNEYHLLRKLQSGPVFMYSKVSTASLSASNCLERLGFNLIDTSVVFEKQIAPTYEFVGYCTARFATSEDRDPVVELARESFVYSRFHLDSAIPGAVADAIKAKWVGNYFAGKRGDEMVVASVGETVVGFLLLLRSNNSDLVIDLIAVDGNQRRRGIAGDMIAYAESRCRGCSRVLVGTQVVNIPSIRLYEKIGFRMCASKYVFHYHNLHPEGK